MTSDDDAFEGILKASGLIFNASGLWRYSSPLSGLAPGAREHQITALVDGFVQILEENDDMMSPRLLLHTAMDRYKISEDDGSRVLSRLIASGQARFTEQAEVELLRSNQ